MQCNKCKLDFQEKDIQLSHDIPKYLGGTDKDGRHWLCNQCHIKYEEEILKLCLMYLLKNSNEEIKRSCRTAAGVVQKYFFK